MSHVVQVDRREFLRSTGLVAGALVLGCRAFETGKAAAAGGAQRLAPDVFLSLDESGGITIVAHRSEMGQGVRTSLPLVVADELEAAWDKVRVAQADGDAKYGGQDTDGSHSVTSFFQRMREAGATARHMLVAAAAQTWAVDPAECEASEHRVVHRKSGRSLGYGELVAKAAALPVPPASSVQLKPRSRWRYIGKPQTLVDVGDIVTGKAVYGIDAELPGMLHASVERCPSVGGNVASFDPKPALAVPGVRHVVPIPGSGLPPAFKPIGGVAVVADTTWAAMKGRRALKVEWELGPNGDYDSERYRKELEDTALRVGHAVRDKGDVVRALRLAARTVKATYYAPHLSQSPMEPPCALARVAEGKCEVWAPTQNPQGARTEVAKALGIEPDSVTVHVTLLGGGFGRKSKPDFIVEAALLAKEAGRPVKVTWTREDDIRHGYYHSVSCQRLEAGLDAHGRPVAWLHRSVFPSIETTFDVKVRRAGAGELGMGLVDVPFDVPNLRCEIGEAQAHVRIGWLRSVANIYHAFAIGSFVDELAAAAGADPKDYLLELVGPPRKLDPAAEGAEYPNYDQPLGTYPIDTGRLRNVIELAAEKSGWGRKLAKGRGRGIAAHRSFLTYVATVVEVSVAADGSPRVEEVHCALDCGMVVNPDMVKAQIQGAVVFGLSLALDGRITARNGRIEQANFHDYPVLRIDDAPRTVGTWLVDSDAPPAGVGEPAVPPVAPALANALFAATGRRSRELPLRKTAFA